MSTKVYSGCVEDRNDPLRLGRCRVRILGIHASDKTVLKTEDLPWASPLMPINSAGVTGVGTAPVGPVPGSWVSCVFFDDDMQQPIMIGSIPGIPQQVTEEAPTSGMISSSFKANSEEMTPGSTVTIEPIDGQKDVQTIHFPGLNLNGTFDAEPIGDPGWQEGYGPGWWGGDDSGEDEDPNDPCVLDEEKLNAYKLSLPDWYLTDNPPEWRPKTLVREGKYPTQHEEYIDITGLYERYGYDESKKQIPYSLKNCDIYFIAGERTVKNGSPYIEILCEKVVGITNGTPIRERLNPIGSVYVRFTYSYEQSGLYEGKSNTVSMNYNVPIFDDKGYDFWVKIFNFVYTRYTGIFLKHPLTGEKLFQPFIVDRDNLANPIITVDYKTQGGEENWAIWNNIDKLRQGTPFRNEEITSKRFTPLEEIPEHLKGVPITRKPEADTEYKSFFTGDCSWNKSSGNNTGTSNTEDQGTINAGGEYDPGNPTSEIQLPDEYIINGFFVENLNNAKTDLVFFNSGPNRNLWETSIFKNKIEVIENKLYFNNKIVKEGTYSVVIQKEYTRLLLLLSGSSPVEIIPPIIQGTTYDVEKGGLVSFDLYQFDARVTSRFLYESARVGLQQEIYSFFDYISRYLYKGTYAAWDTKSIMTILGSTLDRDDNIGKLKTILLPFLLYLFDPQQLNDKNEEIERFKGFIKSRFNKGYNPRNGTNYWVKVINSSLNSLLLPESFILPSKNIDKNFEKNYENYQKSIQNLNVLKSKIATYTTPEFNTLTNTTIEINEDSEVLINGVVSDITTDLALQAEYAKIIKGITRQVEDVYVTGVIPPELLATLVYESSRVGLSNVYSTLYDAYEVGSLIADIAQVATITEQLVGNAGGILKTVIDDIGSTGVRLLESYQDLAGTVIEGTIDTLVDGITEVLEPIETTIKTIETTITDITAILEDPIGTITDLAGDTIDDVIDRLLGKISFIADVFDWLGTAMPSVKDGYNAVMSAFGFNSPFGKWPLRTRMNESDTNRLARGETKDTCIDYIEQKRKKGIKTAFGAADWDQPEFEYGCEYPYCTITESESGHVSYQDDTPDKESTLQYHRTGTFTHIDHKGAQTNKIVGSNYTVIDKNGRIFIEGACTVTVGRDVLIKTNKNLMIEVGGETVLKSKKVYIN